MKRKSWENLKIHPERAFKEFLEKSLQKLSELISERFLDKILGITKGMSGRFSARIPRENFKGIHGKFSKLILT